MVWASTGGLRCRAHLVLDSQRGRKSPSREGGARGGGQRRALGHPPGVGTRATLFLMNGQPSLFGDPPEPEPKVVVVRPYKRRAPHRDLTPHEVHQRTDATRVATEAGIDAADEHADEEWKGVALACVRACALAYSSFCADEVWLELEGFPELGTHEPAALGPVFLRAAKLGWITNSGQRRKRSIYAQRHRELTLWNSTLMVPNEVSPANTENNATVEG